MTAPIPMRRFPSDEYSAFHDYGVGAFFWEDHDNGLSTMTLIVPDERDPEGITVAGAVVVQKGKTAPEGHQGAIWDWNGDRDAPTLSPSLLVHPGGWHGYVRAGELITI